MVVADTAPFPITVTGILEAVMGTQIEAMSNQEKGWICDSSDALFTVCPVTHVLPYSSAPSFTFYFLAELSPYTDWYLLHR